MAKLRWFLAVYYVPNLSSLLAAIGTKLIDSHGDLQTCKWAILMKRLRGMTPEEDCQCDRASQKHNVNNIFLQVLGSVPYNQGLM